jgi:hypothetical protein
MTQTTETAAPARVRSDAEKAAIRRGYGYKKAAEAKAAARQRAIRQSYVDRKVKDYVAKKIADGKAVAKAKRIAESYARKAGVAA